jgi:hypothetical protein
MPQFNIAGPGQGMPIPQNLYPGNLLDGPQTPYTAGVSEVALPAGDALPIPAGTYFLQVGAYSLLQWLDPITGIWRGFSSTIAKGQTIVSDGFTRRVANLTGCPVAAVVTTVGSGYSQATTTVTSNAGGSTWQPIIGGLLTLTTISVAGAGYTVPPICIMPSCPVATGTGNSFAPYTPNGVPATATAGIASGTVSTLTLTNQGAGYPAGFTVTLLPDPTDPNIASITNAVAVFGITGAGTLAAVLCTNNGAPGTTATTLTVTGSGGSNAAATAQMLWTAASTTVTANGAGYGAQSALFATAGGGSSATAVRTNPSIELTGFIPRQAQGVATGAGTLGSISTIGTLYDSGLFLSSTPVGLVLGGAPTTFASITIGLGSKPDNVIMNPV